MKFEELTLAEPLLKAVRDLGFVALTPVQEASLPVTLVGEDVMVQAQTGSGKTACFVLAAFMRLLERPKLDERAPRVVILAPTRELALQIASDAEQLGTYLDFTILTCIGGTKRTTQQRKLEQGVDVVVGTPGRMLDLHRGGSLPLNFVEFFVLDEADRMFDMGFIDDITFFFRRLPRKHKRQSMLFSATLPSQVRRLAWRFMNDPKVISIQPESVVTETVEQALFHVSTREKVSLLLGLLEREKPTASMVFVNTKRVGERLAWSLTQNGRAVAYMSGDLPQNKRLRIIEAVKKGEITLLIATDVASRGLHVDDLSHVFNYDVPNDPEDYVHRIGRTGRAGASGKAFTLACEDFVMNLPPVEQYIESKIPVEFADDDLYLPDNAPRYRPAPGKTFVGWPPEDPTTRADRRSSRSSGSRGGRRRR